MTDKDTWIIDDPNASVNDQIPYQCECFSQVFQNTHLPNSLRIMKSANMILSFYTFSYPITSTYETYTATSPFSDNPNGINCDAMLC